MKLILLALIPVLSSCTYGKFVYDMELQHPVVNNKLDYENDTMSLDLAIYSKGVSVKLLNKTNEGLKISWDDVSLSLNGKASRVVHKETGVLSVNMVQPSTTIPPKSLLDDILYPRENVRTVGSMTYISDMIPDIFNNKKERERGLKLKNTQIVVFLPYYISGKYISGYYNIYIRDVKAVKNR